MKMGYAFHWMPGKLPVMVTPKQGFVHLQYLVSDGKLRSNRHRPWHWSRTMSQTRTMMVKTIYPPPPLNPQRLKVNIIMGQSTSDHPEGLVRCIRLP